MEIFENKTTNRDMSGSVKANRVWNVALSHTENFVETEIETFII